MWITEKHKVDRLASRANANKQALNAKTQDLRRSARETLASPEVLVWSFAAGAFRGAVRDPKSGSPVKRALRKLLDAMLTWRLANQIFF